MRKSLVFTALLLMMAGAAAAQNVDVEALSGVQFDFGNPGARSLGMGGAFLGRADDASAAEANPAGLTILRKPEVSVEGRNFQTNRDFITGGTWPDFNNDVFRSYSRRAELSFASVVLPMNNFAIAGYYSHPIAFNSTVVSGIQPINFFLGANGPVTAEECASLGAACDEYRLYPFGSAVSVDFKTYGLAGAWKLGNLSLGAAARYQKLNESAFTLRTDFSNNPLAGLAQVADDHDITFTAGFKWAASNRFSFGGVYKEGAKIPTQFLFGNFAGDGSIETIATPDFHVPDVMGVGISFQPTTALTINADAVSVKYSNLSDNFVSFYNPDTPDYKAKDIVETRVGAEYFFNTRIPFAIRGGWWKEPAHRIYYNGPLQTSNQVAASIIFPEGKDQTHYSVGVGFAWPGFKIDAAYDTSDYYKVGSLSAVLNF